MGMCVSYTYGALLTANGNMRALNYMALGAVGVSVLLNVLLIPRYQALGAAMANACTQLVTIVVHVLLARRYLHIGIRVKLLLRLILFVVLSLAMGSLLRRSIDRWQLGWLSAMVCSAGVALLLGLLRYRDVIKVLGRREE